MIIFSNFLKSPSRSDNEYASRGATCCLPNHSVLTSTESNETEGIKSIPHGPRYFKPGFQVLLTPEECVIREQRRTSTVFSHDLPDTSLFHQTKGKTLTFQSQCQEQQQRNHSAKTYFLFFLETEPWERVPRNTYKYLNIRSTFPKIAP